MKIKYYAEDGKQFDTLDACTKYESEIISKKKDQDKRLKELKDAYDNMMSAFEELDTKKKIEIKKYQDLKDKYYKDYPDKDVYDSWFDLIGFLFQ